MRQFIELAVNMPEQEPQVGQAERSTSVRPSSSTSGEALAEMAVIRSVGACATPSTTTALPASIGPPETNTVGMLSRIAALSMPGVILSQFEMQTRASTACPWTMCSTLSAMTSREGSECSIPPWPMAMPSSTAIVWNSRATPPASRTVLATSSPISLRWTWPGHELRVGVRDGDQRLAEVVVGHAGGPPQGAGACGVAALGGDAGTERRHGRSSSGRMSCCTAAAAGSAAGTAGPTKITPRGDGPGRAI